jgi:tRNA A37 threonylcarbamoyladenosine biosynthesis protein TsaE
LGLEDALEQGAALIEWPDRAGDRLPPGRLTVQLHAASDGRRADLSGPSRWQELAHG